MLLNSVSHGMINHQSLRLLMNGALLVLAVGVVRRQKTPGIYLQAMGVRAAPRCGSMLVWKAVAVRKAEREWNYHLHRGRLL